MVVVLCGVGWEGDGEGGCDSSCVEMSIAIFMFGVDGLLIVPPGTSVGECCVLRSWLSCIASAHSSKSSLK